MTRRAILPLMLRGEADTAQWIRDQGGSVTVNAGGQITGVFLGYTWITDSDIDRIASLRKVEKLDLAMGQIGERGLNRLRDIRSVTDLTLYHAEFVADVAMANLGVWKQLTRLNVRGTDITDTSMEYIGGLTNLRRLDISFTQVTNNGLEYLANLTELDELALGGNKVSGAGMAMLRSMPSLRSLNVNGGQKRNSGIWSASIVDLDMDLFGSLRSLEEIDLGGTRVTDLGIRKLISLKKLSKLDVSRTDVAAAGLDAIASLPLRRLSLWKCPRIDDNAVRRLASMSNLRVLDISETAVTDGGLTALSGLPLGHLYLSGTQVSLRAVEGFRKEHPQCFVSA